MKPELLVYDAVPTTGFVRCRWLNVKDQDEEDKVFEHQVVWALEHLLRRFPGKIVAVWTRCPAPAHDVLEIPMIWHDWSWNGHVGTQMLGGGHAFSICRNGMSVYLRHPQSTGGLKSGKKLSLWITFEDSDVPFVSREL